VCAWWAARSAPGVPSEKEEKEVKEE